MKLNLDQDIAADVEKDLDPSGAWFSQLPVHVQLAHLAPYVRRQERRDRARLKAAA